MKARVQFGQSKWTPRLRRGVIVAQVTELPGRIIAYLQRTPLIVQSEVALADKTQSALEKAVILLRAQTGHDFSLYKGNIFYISGHTGKYPGTGRGQGQLEHLCHGARGSALGTVRRLPESAPAKGNVALHGLKVETNGGEQCSNATIQRLEEPGPLQGLVMIVFTDVATPEAAKAAVRPPIAIRNEV